MSETTHGPRLVPDPAPADDAEVARLLRLAGHRPEAPPADAAIVKAAVRGQWRQTVRSRRRWARVRYAGGWLAAAALVLLFVNLGLERFPGSQQLAPVATVTAVTGPSAAGDGGPKVGDTVLAERVLTTGGAGEPRRLALELAGGASLRLDKNSRLTVLSGSEMVLERGAVYVDSGIEAGGDGLAIRTEWGIARDIGTQFQVRLVAKGLRVQVREGKVVLDRDGSSYTAEAGSELAVRPDGTVLERDIPLYGPLWQWVLDVAPPFMTQGKMLPDFLAWLCREGGWELRFDPAELAADAAATTLGGGIEGLEPLEAADMVLRASGFTYELNDGTFLVVERH